MFTIMCSTSQDIHPLFTLCCDFAYVWVVVDSIPVSQGQTLDWTSATEKRGSISVQQLASAKTKI